MTRNLTQRWPLLAAVAGFLLLGASTAVLAAGPGVHGRVLGHDEQGRFLGVVPGAKLVFRSAGGAPVAEKSADANGYYKVDLPPGEYNYEIDAPGYRKEDAGRGMRLTQSQGYAIFNLALTKGEDDPARKPRETPSRMMGKLRGRVLEKVSPELRGIPDARITLRREGSRGVAILHSRSTADDQHQAGDYEIALEAGSYRASVRASGFETFVDLQPIEIRADETTERDFVLQRPEPPVATDQGIRGLVTIVDSGATPPPIRLQIRPLGSAGSAPLEVAPESSGVYRQPLAPGRYRVVASAEGFPSAASPPVYVLSGQFTLVNLTLRAERVPEPQTIVDVFVYERTPESEQPIPLAGARVALLKAGGDPEAASEAITDGTGHAIFPVSSAGEYVASAFLKGYRSGTGQGTVALGQHHEVGIALEREAVAPRALALRVDVIDAANKRPLAGARVIARHEDESLAEAARGATDAAGTAALVVHRTGSHAALAQLAGYEPAGTKTNVVSGAANRVVIALRPIATVDVRPEPIKPPDERPPDQLPAEPRTVTGYVAYRELSGQLRSVPGAKLHWERIAPPAPAASDFAATGKDGRYEVRVPLGTYQVRVDPPAGFEGLLEQVPVNPAEEGSRGPQEKYFIVVRSERPPPVDGTLLAVEGTVVTEVAGRLSGVRGAEVVFQRAQKVEHASAGSGGAFALRLPAERYRVSVRARGYEPLETQSEVRPGMPPLRYVLKRSEPVPSTFGMNVFVVERGRTGAAATRPVPEAKVHVSLGALMAAAGETNRSGQFAARVKPGSYTVRVDKPGYGTATAQVEISTKDVTQQVVLTRRAEPPPEEAEQRTLSVRVSQQTTRPPMSIKPTGTPLAGAQVTVMLGSRRVATGTTSTAGTYRVPLAPGNYSVKVEAQGFSPAGKTISLTTSDAEVQVQLDRRPTTTEEATRRDETSPPDRKRRPTEGARPPVERPVPPGGAVEVHYVVEYRLNSQSPWTVLTTRSTQREANMALFQAVERGQIPGSAETRIRVEKQRRTPVRPPGRP